MNNVRRKDIIGVLLFLIIITTGLFIYKTKVQFIFFTFVIVAFALLFISAVKQGAKSEKIVKINEERFQITLSHISEIIFDNVLEADITKDVLLGENAKKLTNLLGIDENATYTETIEAISNTLVKKEFSETYRKTLSKENLLKCCEAGENSLEYECIERSDGEKYRWIRIHICIFSSKITNTIRIISYVKNIDQERKKLEELLEKAERDSLTGLYNRLSTIETTQNILSNESGKTHAVLMFDVDNFKTINDTYGHVVGDAVLVRISRTLKELFRNTDIVGRFGGDEFLAFMSDVSDKSMVEKKAAEICSTFRTLQIGERIKAPISLSIGIAMTDGCGTQDFNELYHQADMALYEAKENGRDQFFFYKAK